VDTPPRATPPLVCLDRELNISSLSLDSRTDHGLYKDTTMDTVEVELLNIAGSCEHIKAIISSFFYQKSRE
jgi:hypothetical protein